MRSNAVNYIIKNTGFDSIYDVYKKTTAIRLLVANLVMFCNERDFMMSLSDEEQTDVIDAFNTTSRYQCIATDCMLGGQPNHGWQLCFPLKLHASGSDFRLYDGSDLNTYLLKRW